MILDTSTLKPIPWHYDTLTTSDTSTPRDKTDTDTNNKGETMPKTIATTTTKASENVKFNPLKPFTGKRSDFVLFMQDVMFTSK
jgi:hypothetical protein